MNKEYIAVIQAGGKGTRMVSLTQDLIPKPMLLINGKPMIEWQIENLKEYGIQEIYVIVGHLGEKIEEYLGDGNILGVRIHYIREKKPLGSAGSLFYLKDIARNRNIILVFGDVMMKLDWKRMMSFHEKKDATATLLVHPNSHPYDSDLVVLDEEKRVVAFDSKKNKRDYAYDNLVNAGIYILSGKLLKRFKRAEKLDLEKDVLVSLLEEGKIYGYQTPEYVKDAGTPERFAKCCEEQKRGVWDAKCLCNEQRAIFIDRDGTMNKFRGLISTEDALELEEGVAEAVRMINESGYLAICVTNQPVVARGMCSIEDVQRIHRKLATLLGNQGAFLDDIIFCPHHPDKGYLEENPIYKVKCDCRKPSIGMIQRMQERYNINLSKSYMIGDSTIDIQTGINAALQTILVRTGQAGKDGKYDIMPDEEADNLLEAINKILG